MMAAPQLPATAIAMKMILKATTKRLAAMLAGMCANVPRREEFDYMRHRHASLSTDPSRIPAYLRRRRLALRLQFRCDADALNPWRKGAR
jgi:hypothetical protein